MQRDLREFNCSLGYKSSFGPVSPCLERQRDRNKHEKKRNREEEKTGVTRPRRVYEARGQIWLADLGLWLSRKQIVCLTWAGP